MDLGQCINDFSSTHEQKRKLDEGDDGRKASPRDEGRPGQKRSREESPPNPGPGCHSHINSPAETSGELSASPFSNPASTFSWPSTTHDTAISSFHYPTIHDFTKELQTAIDTCWNHRGESKYSKYTSVKVLLVSWQDDDLGVEREIDELGQLFECAYMYEVEKWKIPFVDSQGALDEKVRDVVKVWRTSTSLLIFYYAGHARPSRHLGSYPVWVS